MPYQRKISGAPQRIRTSNLCSEGRYDIRFTKGAQCFVILSESLKNSILSYIYNVYGGYPQGSAISNQYA